MPDPTTISPRPIPQPWSHLVALNSTYRVLICRSHCCRYALRPAAIARHLYNRHGIGIDIRRQVQQYVKHFPFTYDHATVPLPADGSAPQPILPVLHGFACRACPFKSTNRSVMRKHANQAHDQKRVVDKDIFAAVCLQSWFGEKRERYWVVVVEEEDHQDDNGYQHQQQAVYSEESNSTSKPRPRRLQCTPDTALYIQRTDWLTTFAKLQHWRAMRELTYTPKAIAKGPSALQLQLGDTALGLATYEYTAETEEVLDYIMQHMPLVWDGCKTTFSTTPVAFHAYLASYIEGTAYKRTFAWVQNQETF